MSISKKPLAIVAAVIVLGFLGWGLYQAFQPQRLPLQGQMDAQEVNVSSKVPGRVGELYVKLGQTVPKGELLFQLTSPEVDAKIAQATAATQSIGHQQAANAHQLAALVEQRRAAVVAHRRAGEQG